MLEDTDRPRTPLDMIASGDNLEILKAAIPYVTPKGQMFLSLYAKFQEIKNLMNYFQKPDLSMMSTQEKKATPEEMLKDLQKYAQGPIKESIDSILFTISALELLSMNQENPQGQEDYHGKQLDE